MKPRSVLRIRANVHELTVAPEMMMGVQYFDGSLMLLDTRATLHMTGLIFSSYYVMPIADSSFESEYATAHGRRSFFTQGGTVAEYCCIIEDFISGWSLAWEEDLPEVAATVEYDRAARSLDSQAQLVTFLNALSQSFPQQKQKGLIPPPGTPRTVARQTTGEEGFLRFTHQVPDKRVDSTTGTVVAGTYCSPFRDGQKITSGFEAVGRFALPVPLPYKHMVLLVPPAGTQVQIGTVVPNFGQAGGGVEALFPTGFTNPDLHYHVIAEY